MKPGILVPVDSTSISEEVLRFADGWAQEKGWKLHVLHCRTPEVQSLIDRGELADPQDAFDSWIERFPFHQPHERLHRFGKPADAILDAMREVQPELVIMAAHAHTLVGRLFLGSNTDTILHQGHSPVYVYKRPAKSLNPKVVVVPVDLGEISGPLLHKADQLALRHGATLHLLFVMDIPEVYLTGSGGAFYGMSLESGILRSHHQEQAQQAKDQMQQILDTLNLESPVELHVDFGTPYLRILGLAEQLNAGLIAMAAHDHSTLGRLLMGSNTDYVVHHFDGPVYVHKKYQKEEPPAIQLGKVE